MTILLALLMRFFLGWSRICCWTLGLDFSGEVEQESAPEVEIVHEAFRTNSPPSEQFSMVWTPWSCR